MRVCVCVRACVSECVCARAHEYQGFGRIAYLLAGFRAQGFGCTVCGLVGFRAEGLGCNVNGLVGFRV
jgi:hypothetical protein